MTWKITPGWTPVDSNAAAYIAAVEAADGQALENGVKVAIDNFVLGCKADGIWPAIKASCILAGARTLNGALVPLVGTAPTNNNFVSGDYSRKTGLVGNGSTKYLNVNRNNNADPQDSKHASVYASTLSTAGFVDLGSNLASSGTRIGSTTGTTGNARLNSFADSSYTRSTGLTGISRNSGTSFLIRSGGTNQASNVASIAPENSPLTLFTRPAVDVFSNARLAFYSIGEALDLTSLDARVTTLINAIAAAIP